MCNAPGSGVRMRPTAIYMTLYVPGKTSVVTGGNSGIGVETVKALATAGSRVVLTSRSVEAGSKIAEQLRAEGIKVNAPPLSIHPTSVVGTLAMRLAVL